MDMHWYQQLSTTNTPSYFYCQQDGVQDQYHIFFCFQARQKLRRGVGSLSFPFPPFWTFSPPRASYHASILPFLPKNRRPSHLCSTANERGFFLKICDVEHGVYTKQFGLVFREEENNVVSSHYFLRGLFQQTHKTMKHSYVTCVVGHECVQSDFGTKGLRMTVTKCRIALDTNINKPFEMPFTVSPILFFYSFTLVSHSNRNECKKFQRRPLFLGVDCKLHIFKETFSILFPIEMKLPIFLLYC